MNPSYTAPEVIMMLGGLGVLLTGIGAVIVNVIVALKSGNKLDEVKVQSTAIEAQVREVHTLTNSNLSAVKAELRQAREQITGLRDVVNDLKNEREKTATVQALHTPVPAKDAGATIPIPDIPFPIPVVLVDPEEKP